MWELLQKFNKKYAKREGVLRFSALIALAILVLGLAYYLYHIDRWLAYDDEGGYLYAAWRISEGEMPYRDFLTPKLPLFLYPGALLLKLSGDSIAPALALRAASALAVVLSALFLYLIARRIFGAGTAGGCPALAMAVFMAHQDVYWSARFFRPEAYMLFYSMVGMYLFVCFYHEDRRSRLSLRLPGLAASGIFFALSTLARLFGFLPMAGCIFFMIYDAIRGREVKRVVRRAAWLLGPYIAVAGAGFALFYYLTPNFFDAILGHHLKQGSELSPLQVFLKGLGLYWAYLRGHPILLLLTIPALVRSFGATGRRHGYRLQALFACQIPTAAAFLILSRELAGRHLVYLVPSLSALFAASAASLTSLASSLSGARPQKISWRGAGLIIVFLLTALALWPSWQRNRLVASWRENDTQPLAEYIQTHTEEDDFVLSDYPGLNFYARRKNTPLGAGLSRGATLGGQILGQDLIQEMEEKQVKMVLVNIAQGAHQLANLRDYDDFHRYVQDHFHLAGRMVYDYRLLEVYHLNDLMPQALEVNFGDKIMLTGLAGGDRPTDLIEPSKSVGLDAVEAGGELIVTLRWRSLAAMEKDYYLVLSLMDEQGKLWGMGQKQLMDIETETYWDEEGLERAVQFPTSQWPVGEVVLDFYKLPVLPGTPPGRYQIMARLRPLDAWDALEVRDPDGTPSGFDYTLGTLQVTRPAQPPTLAKLAIPHPVMEDAASLTGDEIQLMGYELAATEVRSGDTLHLTLFWRALKRMSKEYDLLLKLQDAAASLTNATDSVWAEGRFPLARATPSVYPTTQWTEGEVVRGQYELIVDVTAPSSECQLTLNLVDKAAGRRLLEHDIVLTKVTIEGIKRQFAVPETIRHPTASLTANLGDYVTLLGYDLAETEDFGELSRAVEPGGVLHLTLYWQAQREMETSYKVFTHLLDEEEQIRGQKDSIPVGGTRPTTGWLPGEVIVDKYEIPVRPDAPPGEYVIEIGMYDAETMQRLRAFDEEGARMPDDRILVPISNTPLERRD